MLSPHLAERALESAPDAILVCDAEGRIVFANTQAGVLFGFATTELLGCSVEVLLPKAFRSDHLIHRATFALAPRTRPMGTGLDLRACRKDGTEFPVEISLSAVRDGDHTLVTAVVRDVTEHNRIETALRAAREAADRANQAKSRFLSTASHDLRQPLQSLALLNGTLRRLSADRALSDALAQQGNAITAMSRLLDTLLDISKLESGAIQPEITDFTVASIFEELRREFASLALNKGVQLEVESCDKVVRSDPSLVEQILRNLVSNAIRYTHRGRVLLRCLHDAAVVRLEVLDTGIGIPADQVPYIFEEFYQVGVKPNTHREGYGLGLSIVSRLVKLLELKLDVHSDVGKGSSFRLGLPASPMPIAAVGPIVTFKKPGMHRGIELCRRVLLVEDDSGVCDATRLLLETEGYDVVTAASGAEALERLDASPYFDLVLADYHLGGETGLHVISSARRRIGTHLAAILMSGDTSPVVRSLELQRDARLRIVSKPMQAERLLELMSELLAQSAGRHEAD